MASGGAQVDEVVILSTQASCHSVHDFRGNPGGVIACEIHDVCLPVLRALGNSIAGTGPTAFGTSRAMCTAGKKMIEPFKIGVANSCIRGRILAWFVRTAMLSQFAVPASGWGTPLPGAAEPAACRYAAPATGHDHARPLAVALLQRRTSERRAINRSRHLWLRRGCK